MLDADEAYFKEHGEPLYSSHMIDLSEEDKESNIATTASKTPFRRHGPFYAKNGDRMSEIRRIGVREVRT